VLDQNCADQCPASDVLSNNQCYKLRSLDPTGDINIYEVKQLTLDYSGVTLVKGAGTITVTPAGAAAVLILSVADSRVTVSGSQVVVNVDHVQFTPDLTYTVAIPKGTFTTNDGGHNEAFAANTWTFTTIFALQPFSVVLNSNQIAIEARVD
jgi:hypothetical protein